MTPVSRERGQTTAEYVGLIVLVVAVLGAVAASPIGEVIASRVSCAIAGIGGGGGCEGASKAGGPGPSAPTPPGAAPAPAADASEEEDDGGNPLSDAWGAVTDAGGDFATGAWEGVKDVGGELGDTAVGIGRHVNVFDLDATGEQWQQTLETAEQVVTHPWESTKAVASSFWDPIAESYAHGGVDEALGRGLVTGAGAVVGGKGLTKVGSLGRAARVADAAPDRPRTPGASARRERAARANCVSNSFTASTPVLMASGERRTIARVELGERVLATDPRSGETGARAVERVIVGEGRKTLVRVRVSGKVISATDRHPFWVEGRRAWVGARDLRPGDMLREPGGERAPVESVRALAPEPERVYNLTVAGLHTYYAGEAPVLVHNENCPEGSQDESSFASGRPPHTADVTVTRNGETMVDETLRSGGMSAQERALGFPRSSLATHTEARAVRRFPLQPGDSMTINGRYPPCPSCKGAMNRAAREQGATVVYQWPGGTWTAGAQGGRSR